VREKQHSSWGIPVEQLLRYVLSKRGELAVAATYICTIATFIVAYAHPTRSVLVTVDQFNEADLEVALILLSLPAAFRFLTESLLRDHNMAPQPSLKPIACEPLGPALPLKLPFPPPPSVGPSLHRWGTSIEQFLDTSKLVQAHNAVLYGADQIFSPTPEEAPWVT